MRIGQNPGPLVAGITVVLMAALLSGCGAVGPPQQPQVRKASVGVGGPTLTRMPYYLAYQLGTFKQNGLELQVENMSSGADSVKLAASGKVDFLVGQFPDILNANTQGINLQATAILSNKISNNILVRKAAMDQVKSMADLKGPSHPIGVPSIGSGAWQFVVYVAQQSGVTKDELVFIPVATGTAAVGAMQAGRIDAAAYSDPGGLDLVRRGLAQYLVDTSDPQTHQRLMGGEYIDNLIAISADTANNRPELAQAFADGIQQALNWAATHSSAELGQMLSGYPGFDQFEPDILMASLERGKSSIPATAITSRQAFDNSVKLPIAVGSLDKAPAYELIVNNKFAEAASKKYPPAASK